MILIILKVFVPLFIILNLLPLLIWAERKGSAFIQDRHGPNRASFFGLRMGGLLHSLADVVKLFTKEDIIPSEANKPFYLLAPFIALSVACVTFIVIPFGDVLTIDGREFTLQAANLNVGILYTLAMASLGVFGVMLAGWAANNKYALLGGIRSSAQMFSYEISMGLALMGVVVLAGSIELGSIVTDQSAMPWHWNIIRQPLAFLLFTVAAFAETNRTPFDLPEGESELVAGYHTEYSSMKFAMFFMAEYIHIIIASALIATLFFGGWQVPFLSTQFLRDHAESGLTIVLLAHALLFLAMGIGLLTKFKPGRYGDNRDYENLIFGGTFFGLGLAIAAFTLIFGAFSFGDLGREIFAAVIQFGSFMAKLLFFCWVFIWVRWTLPRFRYDQLMHLGWKVMIPLGLANLAITAVLMLIWN